MKKRKIDENNPVPEWIFIPNKISRIISLVLITIINLCSLIYGVLNFNNFSSDVLVKTVEFGFTIVLSIMALTITVFQSDKNLLKNKNSDKNIKKVYLSYIFIVFPIILILFLGYLIACLFYFVPYILSLSFMVTILTLTMCITKTLSSFVALLNIKD